VNLWCLYCSYNLNCFLSLLLDGLLERQSSTLPVAVHHGWDLSILPGTGQLTVHSASCSSFIFTSHTAAWQFCAAMSILIFSLIHILPVPMSVLEEQNLVFFSICALACPLPYWVLALPFTVPPTAFGKSQASTQHSPSLGPKAKVMKFPCPPHRMGQCLHMVKGRETAQGSRHPLSAF